MSEPFTLRSATLADYGEVCALHGEGDELHRLNLPWMFQKPATEARTKAAFEQLIANENSRVLVAAAGDWLVGVATVLLRAAPDFALFISQRWGVLDNISVSTTWRRRGVGSALIREAERWAKAQGANWLELGVYAFNEAARSFYAALGYAPVLTKLRKPFDG